MIPAVPAAAAGLQARLDQLNVGRWTAGPSGTSTWVPDAGPLGRIVGSAVPRCLGKPHVWIHLLGDSTVRYMYAAWLTLLNGTERAQGYPRHELPDSDRCSFARAGRAEFQPCVSQWRGIFADEAASGLLRQRAEGDGWSLSYEAWHVNTSAPLQGDLYDDAPFSRLERRFWQPGRAAGRRGPPDLLLFSTGVWEAFGGRASGKCCLPV